LLEKKSDPRIASTGKQSAPTNCRFICFLLAKDRSYRSLTYLNHSLNQLATKKGTRTTKPSRNSIQIYQLYSPKILIRLLRYAYQCPSVLSAPVAKTLLSKSPQHILIYFTSAACSNWSKNRGLQPTTKEQKWWPSVGYHPRSVVFTEVTTGRASHDHTSALCAIKLFIVSNIRQDIFEHILERSLMHANSRAAQKDFRDRMNLLDTRGYTTTPTSREELTRHARLFNMLLSMEDSKKVRWLQ